MTALITGCDHAALLTHDLDRLAEFWDDVFDVPIDISENRPLRHGTLRLGPDCVLHVFEVDAAATGPLAGPMFSRGRIDHLGIAATDEAALRKLRDHLVERGASDGEFTLFAGSDHPGGTLSVYFTDPDGCAFQVCCERTGAAIGDDEVRQPAQH